MLMPDAYLKLVTNILNLSPIHFVVNIRRQILRCRIKSFFNFEKVNVKVRGRYGDDNSPSNISKLIKHANESHFHIIKCEQAVANIIVSLAAA